MKNTVIILLVLIFTFSLAAEKIRLKDGGVVRGKVVSETATEIVIANEYGNITIEKKNIAARKKEKTDIPSFKNSKYSFKKRSWTKYAFFITVALGAVTTAIVADPSSPDASTNLAFYSLIGFGTIGLSFALLDFFRYGRVAKRIRRRFTFIDQTAGLNLIASYKPASFHNYNPYAMQQDQYAIGLRHRF